MTYEDIIGKINDVKKSGVFLIEKNFTAMLSGITYDNSTGRIIGARATRMNWLGKMNTTSAKLGIVANLKKCIILITLSLSILKEAKVFRMNLTKWLSIHVSLSTWINDYFVWIILNSWGQQ